MKTISLCMIVCNEEEMLETCLQSVETVVDEIILVDTGSTDNTKTIAKKYDARIIDYIWTDDFSEARNLSLLKATSDWILVLDADECISHDDCHKIKSLVKTNDKDAFILDQRTYGNNLKHDKYVSRGADKYKESQPYNGWISSALVRLFRNNKDYQFRYRIHEVIEPSIKESGGLIGNSKIPIHHYTYEKSKDFVDAKLARYLEYGLKQIEAMPNNPKAYLEVAPLYIKDKNYEKAERLLLDGISKSPKSVDLYDALATLYLEIKHPVKAENIIRKALLLRKRDEVLINKLASARIAQQDFEEAEILLIRARKLSPDSIMTSNNLGLLYALTHQSQKAIDALENTIRICPTNNYALTSIGMLYVNLGQFKRACFPLERSLEVEPNDIRALYHLAISYDNLNKKARALKLLKHAAALQPDDLAIKKQLQNLSRNNEK